MEAEGSPETFVSDCVASHSIREYSSCQGAAGVGGGEGGALAADFDTS